MGRRWQGDFFYDDFIADCVGHYGGDRHGAGWIAGEAEPLIEALGRYEIAGAEHVVLTLRASTRSEYLTLLDTLVTDVIPVVHGDGRAA